MYRLLFIKEWGLADRERWPFWLPILAGGGVGLYFSLPFEPWWGLVLFLLLMSAGFVYWRRSSLMAVALLALMAGFSAASFRTTYMASPMLERKIGPVEVTGMLMGREAREQGSRILLGQLEIEGIQAERTPKRIRINLHRVPVPALPPIGSRIRILANLLPPAEPVAPGGFDFRRQAFFEQIGAYGQGLRPPEIVVLPVSSGFWAERWREYLSEKIVTRITGPEGAIAAALMTGERGAIDEKTNADMRAAGTAHMLSISGMHIGMVGGFVFFFVRAFLALSPWLALHFPIKQWAAVCGLVVVVAYTLLVGSPIPAQRAALMTGLVFLAILLNRQALTMRSVVLAAFFLLVLFPESLLNPGFQMSFAAITLLIALYEWWDRREGERDKRRSLLLRAWRYVAGIVITSVIATIATMPFGAWHFHRIQMLGVLGNLVAVPLTGFIVMPAAVVAYILSPFGLEGWALDAMGWGLRGVTESAARIADMPYADFVVPSFPLWVLLVMVMGGVWLAIWRTPMRWAGAVAMLLGAVLVPLTASSPVLLVSAEGMVAVRGSDGKLYSDRARTRGIAADEWSRAYNGGEKIGSWRSMPDMHCDVLGCVAFGSIAIPRQAVAQVEDCRRATILVAPKYRVRNCERATVIDRHALRQNGAYAVYANGSVETTRQGATRPWQPGFSDTSGSARRDVPAP